MADDLVSEQFTHYTYVPESQGWLVAGGPPESAGPLEQITEGRFFQRGPNLYRSSDSGYVGRVAYVRGSVLEVGSQGSVLLSNTVPRARIDDPLGVDRQPRAVVTGDLGQLGDTTTVPINRIISLAPRGELVYVRDEITSGKERYVKVLTPARGEPVPQRLATGWRLATSEELLIRGVAGYLARNASAALEQWKIGGFTLADGTTTTNGSEIVNALAASLSITPVITYVLGEA